MSSLSRFCNDGSGAAPRLRVYLNLDNLVDLRADTAWPALEGLSRDQRLKDDGFEGVQLTNDPPIAGSPLPHCGLDRINTPAEAFTISARHTDRGDQCVTVHVGWGIEDDREVFSLVEAVLAASDRYRLPIFIETHRATITQDVWRTVQITKKFPEVRFNGDFSHYYCGLELVYGNWVTKLEFMEPIFERIGFMHARIASPGCIQVPIDPAVPSSYLEHFRQLWTRAMSGFLRNALPGDVLIFAPELLASTHFYARLFLNASGRLVEESDRYSQALIFKDLAHKCFAEAQRQIAAGG